MKDTSHRLEAKIWQAQNKAKASQLSILRLLSLLYNFFNFHIIVKDTLFEIKEIRMKKAFEFKLMTSWVE